MQAEAAAFRQVHPGAVRSGPRADPVESAGYPCTALPCAGEPMRSVLVIYMSRQGHTARVARKLCESIVEAGG